MSLRTSIRDWLNAPSPEDERWRIRIETAAEARERDDFNAILSASEPGNPWRYWIHDGPQSGILVQIIRDGQPWVRTIDPNRQPPEWNVWGVYWRYAEEGAASQQPSSPDPGIHQALGQTGPASKP